MEFETDAGLGKDWAVQPDPKDEQEWKDDWDDEMMDGDFITHLRQELAKTEPVGKGARA